MTERLTPAQVRKLTHRAKASALEVEGGTYSRGRHTRPDGFERDCEKYAEATIRGWRVLRVTGRLAAVRGQAGALRVPEVRSDGLYPATGGEVVSAVEEYHAES